MFGLCVRGILGVTGCAVAIPYASVVVTGLTIVSVAGLVSKITTKNR